MKNNFLNAICAIMLLVACNNNPEGEFVDLNTGKTVTVEKDEETGFMVNAATKKPVYLYVNPASKDTFYGRTGKKINNHVVVTSGGKYKYDDEDYVYEHGDYKLKTDDGDVKVKEGDYKMKTDDGDIKVKDGDYKKKTDDGDVKIKNGDTKIKVDDGEVKVKKDN